MAAVEFQNVSFHYDAAALLSDVNFLIPEGSYTGIIGPNGSGKTTVLKLILGLLTPSSGQILIGNDSPDQALSHIGYVPQRFPVDPLFPISAFEVILQGRLAHLPWYGHYGKEDMDFAKEAIKIVRLEPLGDQAFGTLSAGQAQRILIARALAAKPSILILDEPTASIDPNSAREIYTLLKDLSKSITVILVTHDLRPVLQDTRQILTVQGGQVTSMKPAEVCEHFAYGLYHAPMLQDTH